MRLLFLSRTARHVLRHPIAFAYLTLRSFNRNQGLLLAGALAYYALLSILPLLMLSVIVLSHFVQQQELVIMLQHYLDYLVPSQSRAVLLDITEFLKNRFANSAILLAVMLFFSSLAFSVTEKAMAVIFPHRGVLERRSFLVSVLLPYFFAVALCIGMLLVTGASVVIQELGRESIHLFGHEWSLRGVSGVLLYLLGFFGEAAMLTALYLLLPVGPVRLRHAAIGAFAASLLWEIARHFLLWYFSSVSMASVVYGSLATAVIAMFSMEIAATLLLLGAQVIAEYERLEHEYDGTQQFYT